METEKIPIGEPISLPSHLLAVQAANLLGITRQSICKQIKQGKIQTIDILGQKMIAVGQLVTKNDCYYPTSFTPIHAFEVLKRAEQEIINDNGAAKLFSAEEMSGVYLAFRWGANGRD